MKGKELLKYYKTLPEHQQTKILVDAYRQIASLHQTGQSYDSFTWRECSLEGDELKIQASVDDYFNEESLQRNLRDYAGVIYCLVTGRTSAESMSWDAGRKIQPFCARLSLLYAEEMTPSLHCLRNLSNHIMTKTLFSRDILLLTKKKPPMPIRSNKRLSKKIVKQNITKESLNCSRRAQTIHRQ